MEEKSIFTNIKKGNKKNSKLFKKPYKMDGYKKKMYEEETDKNYKDGDRN